MSSNFYILTMIRRWWLLVSILLFFNQGVAFSQPSLVYNLTYHNFNTNSFQACVRLLNGTHQIGCQSNDQGNVGILFRANTSSLVDQFVALSTSKMYILLLDVTLFNTLLITRMKSLNHMNGLLIYEPDDFMPLKWSPDLKCPTERLDLYADNSSYQCNDKRPWNSFGDALSEQDIPFPVFYINDTIVRDKITKCFNDHNLVEHYPLCAVEMSSRMFGAVDGITCERRSRVQSTLIPVGFCDKIGGRNIISSVKRFSNSYSGTDNSTILVTSALDSRSFMQSFSADGVNEATGFITLLGVANALGKLSTQQRERLSKNVVFVIFDAEAFDNIGSSRMVYDMKVGDFPFALSEADSDDILPPRLSLSNVSAVVELRQLGFTADTVYAHYDPVSYEKNTIKTQVDKLISLMKESKRVSVARQSHGLGLAPSSLHSILKERPLPGVVITDYDREFTNTRYFSRFDNLANLNIATNSNMTDDEVMHSFDGLAQKLASISNMVAESIYKYATNNATVPSNVTVDKDVMAQLLFCYLYKPNCKLFRERRDFHSKVDYLSNTAYNRYVSVYGSVREITNVTAAALASFSGQVVTNHSSCVNAPTEKRFSYLYFKGPENGSAPFCVISSTFVMKAMNVHFEAANFQLYADQPGMWAESRWGNDAFRLRMFLIQDPTSQGLVLMAGLLILVISFVVVWFLTFRADQLFTNTGLM